MWKITPNRLTLLRIFLLPVPCFLLFGGPEHKLTAVGLGSLLGFTDFLDGRLARRQGVSRLGSLLDPVADKIFVSVIYLLLYKLHYVAFLPILGIILREILVSGLRSLYPGDLKVWPLARLKTTLQMATAGAIVLVANFAPYPLREIFIHILVALVLGLTWLSALPYFQKVWKKISSQPRLGSRLFLRIILPLSFLFLFPFSGNWWPLLIVGLALCFLGEVLIAYLRGLS